LLGDTIITPIRIKRMLYRVQKGDITRAGKILADAFQNDPAWSKIFEGVSHREKRLSANYEVAIRCGLKYGEVYASSQNLEGIIAWVPGRYADMKTWHLLCSGATGAVMRIGLNVLKRMAPVYKPVTEYRREYMADHEFLYLLVFGVATELHGRGFGRKLIDAVIEKSEQERLPLLVGAGSEDNVKMYEHFGFRVLEKITLRIVGLPEWEMVREPQV
jgi:ribosomal protein S18 acetylase RimI-like enzyme